MSRYKINVLTLSGKILVFHVDELSVVEGGFVTFTDEKTNIIKRFPVISCEIEEIIYGK